MIVFLSSRQDARSQRFATMKFLKQSYLQRAIQEKARGDFAEAAKYYAKAEQYQEVGAMYEMLAEISRSLPEKIQAYQQALHWYVTCNAPARAELAGKLAALMEDDVREDGQIKRAERHTLQQIAEYYATANLWKEAGRLYEELGLPDNASEMYVKGGEIELIEKLSERRELHDQHAHSAEQLFNDAEVAYQAGKRDKAHHALQECLALDRTHARASALLAQLAQALEGAANLRVRLPMQEQEFLVFGNSTITIGRKDENDIVLLDNDVSRAHANISIDGQRVIVADSGSSNGTRINGLRIQKAAELHHQDILGIGRHTKFEVRLRQTRSNITARLRLCDQPHAEAYLCCSHDVLIGQDASCDIVVQQRFPDFPPAFFKIRHHAPYWFLHIHPHVKQVTLNGVPVERYVVLLPGDSLHVEGLTLAVG